MLRARWFSPNGWSHLFLTSSWVIVVPLATTAVLTVVAFRLNLRRDFGAGVVPARRSRAGGEVNVPWRVHRTQLIGWVAAFALAGVTMGGDARHDRRLAGDGRVGHLLVAVVGTLAMMTVGGLLPGAATFVC